LIEKNEQKEALSIVTDKIELLRQIIDSKEELLDTQRKYILELESKNKEAQ